MEALVEEGISQVLGRGIPRARGSLRARRRTQTPNAVENRYDRRTTHVYQPPTVTALQP